VYVVTIVKPSLIMSGIHQATACVNLTFVGLGLVGCFCMIRLATAGTLQRFSCSTFLITLAFSDIVLLVFEAIEDIGNLIPNVTASDILFGTSEWRCRFAVFSQETARVLSSWMVVALAAELYLITCYQNRRAHVATHKRAFQLNISVIIITFASCFPFLVITEFTKKNMCSSKYNLFYDIYAKVIMKCITDTFTPVLYIIWCALCVIIHRVRHEHEKTYTLDYDMGGNCRRKRRDETKTSPSFVLIVVLFYAVLVLPYGITDLLQTLLRLKERYWPEMNLAYSDSYELIFAYDVTRVFLVVAYSCKFYLAFWLDTEFRMALKKECFSFGRLEFPSRPNHDSEPNRHSMENGSANQNDYVYINQGLSVSNNDMSKDNNYVDIGDYNLFNIIVTQF
jgi:hypothetical protein